MSIQQQRCVLFDLMVYSPVQVTVSSKQLTLASDYLRQCKTWGYLYGN